MASTLNGVIVDAFNVLLDYQGTDVVNKRTSATFRAIFNPVFTDNVEAGARYLKKIITLYVGPRSISGSGTSS